MTLCKTAYYLVFRKLCPLSRSKLLDFLWVLAWNSNMNISVIAQYIILDMRECGLVSSKLLQTNKRKETLTWNISTHWRLSTKGHSRLNPHNIDVF